MHSKTLKVDGVGLAVIHHNSDWSGEAIVCWGWQEELVPGGHGGFRHEVRIDGRVLMALSHMAAIDEVTSAVVRTLEDLRNRAPTATTPKGG